MKRQQSGKQNCKAQSQLAPMALPHCFECCHVEVVCPVSFGALLIALQTEISNSGRKDFQNAN